MAEPRKELLNAKEFQDGLAELDREMGSNAWLVAFAPIRILTAGGFLAVSYLKNRDSTGDLDYLMEPEYVGDEDIQRALDTAVRNVALRLRYHGEWMNDAMSIFVTKKSRQVLFERALREGLTLFKGEHLEVLAAPIEWALERKLRRIHGARTDRKVELDMADAVAILKHLRTRNNGPLDLESIRTMNVNGFDVLPDYGTMQKVAEEYRREYNEEIFR